jgi:hypothetical protein
MQNLQPSHPPRRVDRLQSRFESNARLARGCHDVFSVIGSSRPTFAASFVDQPRQSDHRRAFVSKISGDQIIRSPAAANVNPGSSGTYQITIGIERVQKTRLIRTGIRLDPPQRAFVYEKRCLYRAIVSPKSHGMPRSII